MFNIFAGSGPSPMGHIICLCTYLGIVSLLRLMAVNGQALYLIPLLGLALVFNRVMMYVMFIISIMNQRIMVGFGGLILNVILLVRDLMLINYQDESVGVKLITYFVSTSGLLHSFLILFSLFVILTIDEYNGGINESGFEIFGIIIKVYVAFLIFAVATVNVTIWQVSKDK